jgi:hypothetical protein
MPSFTKSCTRDFAKKPIPCAYAVPDPCRAADFFRGVTLSNDRLQVAAALPLRLFDPALSVRTARRR